MMQKKSSASIKHFPEFRSLAVRALLLALSILSGNLPAQEGNYRFENFGNQSVLLNGSVTGSVSDLGLVYYNPARLALIENPAFTIGGKAYQWSRYQFDDVLQTGKGLNSKSFSSLPPTIAGTFGIKNLPQHNFAYSILARQRSDIELNYDSGIVEEEPAQVLPNVLSSFTDISYKDRLRENWFGITWAYAMSEHFSVGVSLFSSIYEVGGLGTILINKQQDNNAVISYNNRISYDQKSFGMFLKAGVGWNWWGVDLGLNVSLPYIAISNQAAFSYQESLGGLSPEEDFIQASDFDELKGRRRTALGVALGAGIPWNRNKLHVNLDWHNKVAPYERFAFPLTGEGSIGTNPFLEQLRPVLNFGAGAEIYLNDNVNFLCSFSSDFSATELGINLFDILNQSDTNINLLNDFWHMALGVDLKFSWAKITLGSSYAATSSRIDSKPEIPVAGLELEPGNFTSNISYWRWRFIIGLEVPLFIDTLKKLPIQIR